MSDECDNNNIDTDSGMETIPAVRHDPRPYQLEIFHQAVERNVIACIDTGGGKTLIAAMLIENILRRADGGPTLCVFLVNNRELGHQQYGVLKKYFAGQSIRIQSYNGLTNNIDQWDMRTWQNEFSVCNVMIMTAGIFLNCLRHAFISLSIVGLMVFDECHHAKKSSPMSLIMKEFYHKIDDNSDNSISTVKDSIVSSLKPRILGLTASPIQSGSKSNAEHTYREACQQLEATLDAVIVTPNPEDVRQYIARPNEITRFFMPADQAAEGKIDAVVEQLQMHIDSIVDPNAKKVVDKLYRGLVDMLDKLGAWCTVVVAICQRKRVNRLVANAVGIPTNELKENVQYANITVEALDRSLVVLKEQYFFGVESVEGSCQSLPSNQSNDSAFAAMRRLGFPVKPSLVHISNRLYDLLVLIKELEDDDALCAIIFVKERMMAVIVSVAINAILGNELLNNKSEAAAVIEKEGSSKSAPVMSLPITGKEIKDVVTDRSLFDEIADIRGNAVLEMFRKGDVKILVATAVAEEGLDIASCKVVVRFNPTEHLLSYIQSRGRARHMNSKYIVMAEKAGKDKIADMRAYEEIMKTVIVDTAKTPSIDRLNDILAPSQPEYRVAATCATISVNSAISLLYQYCQILPRDSYSSTDPLVRYEKLGSESYKCSIELPLNCPVRCVESSIQRSKQEAKQMACFEACKQLHELNALSNNLIPTEWLTKQEEILRQQDLFSRKIVVGNSCDAAPSISQREGLKAIATYPHCSMRWNACEHQLDSIDPKKSVLFHVYEIGTNGFTTEPMALFSVVEQVDKLSVPFIYRDNLMQMNITYLGYIHMSISDMQRIQRYYSLFLSAVLPSSYTSRLLAKPTSFSPIILVPLLSSNVRQQQNLFECINWVEIDGVIAIQSTGLSAYTYDTLHKIHHAKELQDHLLISYHVNAKDQTLKYRRMQYLMYFQSMQSKLLRVERTYAADIDLATVPASKFKTFSDILHSRCRSVSIIDGHECILTKPISSIRAIQRYDPFMISDGNTATEKGAAEDNEISIQLFKENSKMDNCYRIESCIRLAELVDFVVPTKNIIVHPISLKQVKEQLSFPLLVFTAEHLLTVSECKSALIPQLQRLDLLFAALSCPSAQLPFNYERLEILGDSVLKLLGTMYVMHKYPSFHEGQLTSAKSAIICNKHLFDRAIDYNLQRFIISDSFVGRKFLPLGIDTNFEESDQHMAEAMNPIEASGDVADEAKEICGLTCATTTKATTKAMASLDEYMAIPMNHVPVMPTTRYIDRLIAHKTISDVVEAIIGAYYLDTDFNLERVWKDVLCGPLQIIPSTNADNKEHSKEPTSRPFPLLFENFHQSTDSDRSDHLMSDNYCREAIAFVNNVTQYHFTNNCLIIDALTHQTFSVEASQAVRIAGSSNRSSSSSSSNMNPVNCYQRLEFLGDAVIDFIVVNYLYSQQHNSRETAQSEMLTPGEISDWKAFTVRNESLAMCAIRLGLHRHLRYKSSTLAADINEFEAYYNQIISNNNNKNSRSDSINSMKSEAASVGEIDAEDVFLKEILRTIACDFDCNNDDGSAGSTAYNSKAIAAPKVLGDVFESVVGALFVDNNCRINEAVSQFVHRNVIEVILAPLFHSKKSQSFRWGPHRNRITVVSEICSAVGCRQHWTVIKGNNNGNNSNNTNNKKGIECQYVVHDKILATGFGSSRKIAEQMAAKALLGESEKSLEEIDSTGPIKYLQQLKSLCTCCIRSQPDVEHLASTNRACSDIIDTMHEYDSSSHTSPATVDSDDGNNDDHNDSSRIVDVVVHSTSRDSDDGDTTDRDEGRQPH